MSASEDSRREVQFGQLNWLGKTVFISGQVARVAGSVIESVVDRAAEIVVDTEKAFRDGLGEAGGMEDAKILEEYEERRAAD